jgi:ferritin-like metal-binding protein YciE
MAYAFLSQLKNIIMKKSGSTKKISSHPSVKRAPAKKSSQKKTSPSDDLKKIFEDELKDIYWAEKALTKALPKMAKAAASDDLRSAFEDHLEETEGQVARLEDVFKSFDIKAQAKKCEAMDGLIQEAQQMMEEHDKGIIRDAGLIIGAQKVEHYEMAAYGSLRTLASVLGNSEAADLLQETLDEEGNTNKKLTELSETINQMAMEESDEEEVEEDENEMAR